jgi:hypothetical protein
MSTTTMPAPAVPARASASEQLRSDVAFQAPLGRLASRYDAPAALFGGRF